MNPVCPKFDYRKTETLDQYFKRMGVQIPKNATTKDIFRIYCNTSHWDCIGGEITNA